MSLPPKRCRRAHRRWPECLDDLHDYHQPEPGRASCVRKSGSDGSIIVTDDWPERVPIGSDELRVIEGHLRGQLDALLGPLP